MTIEKGRPWGRIGPRPDGVVEVGSDAELGALVARCRTRGEPLPLVALPSPGDLMRTVGGMAVRKGEVVVAPIDIVRVEAEGMTGWFVAHLVARRSWWRGELVAAMNAQFLGEWDVAPRAHPNDGKVDIVRIAASMSVRDRLRADRRLQQGTHLPHPKIELRQVTATELSFAKPLRVALDGTRWTTASRVTLTVEPDALTVVF